MAKVHEVHVVLVLFAAVLAGRSSALPAPAPVPTCCFAQQFEVDCGQMVGLMVDGHGFAIGQSLKMAFDYTSKRMGAITTTYSEGKTYMGRAIIDYTKGIEYMIDDKLQTCQKVPFTPTDMSRCIPDDALFLGTSYLGDHQITADSFAYYLTEGPSTGNFTMQVTKGDCIPLSSSFLGKYYGVEMLSGAGFSNFVRGIKDPSAYFNVPSFCPTSKNRMTIAKELKVLHNVKHLLAL